MPHEVLKALYIMCSFVLLFSRSVFLPNYLGDAVGEMQWARFTAFPGVVVFMGPAGSEEFPLGSC